MTQKKVFLYFLILILPKKSPGEAKNYANDNVFIISLVKIRNKSNLNIIKKNKLNKDLSHSNHFL